MGIGDLFKAGENKQLREKIAQLEALLTPEMRDLQTLREETRKQQETLAELQKNAAQARQKEDAAVASLRREAASLREEIQKAKRDLVETNEEVLMQSFGLYKPMFLFSTALEYKENLEKLRAKQKERIKNETAAVCAVRGWTIDGSASKGAKMLKDMQKLLLRCFHQECDEVIDHVKFNNMEASEKRIRSSAETLSKLGSFCGVSIMQTYVDLKIQELHMAYEYQVAKKEESERLKQLRAEERERARLEKEIAEERKKLEKEEKHYKRALQAINEQLAAAAPESAEDLLRKKQELEDKITELEDAQKQVDYREANQRAGYVYVISNIGSFGEDVYKIGMTRRLEPMDRIDELGDASVPFDFDVHALIFSEDAPALEAALHRAFEDRKLNMVNPRREFFRVSLEEIKKVVRENYEKTAEFVDVAPAMQFRESLLMRQGK